jgi:hypothetical protein
MSVVEIYCHMVEVPLTAQHRHVLIQPLNENDPTSVKVLCPSSTMPTAFCHYNLMQVETVRTLPALKRCVEGHRLKSLDDVETAAK